MSTREGFQIRGADGQTIIVPDSRYYFNTKSRCERMRQNSLSVKARRVYACLELATMGFQQELAVVMTTAGTRSMTPDDVGDLTGMDRQNVRLGLEELENEGLAERRANDEGALRKGHVELYSWAEPRPKKENCSRARLQFPKWFADDADPETDGPLLPLRSLVNRFKLRLTDDIVVARAYKVELEEAARAYKEAEIVALRALERVCAGDPPNKDERTERTEERTVVPSSPEFYIDTEGAAAAAAAAAGPEEKNGKQKQQQPPEKPTQEARTDASEGYKPVRDEFYQRAPNATPTEFDRYIDRCRQAKSDIDPALLARVTRAFPISRKSNPVAILISEVPRLLVNTDLASWLDRQGGIAPPRDLEERAQRDERERELTRLAEAELEAMTESDRAALLAKAEAAIKKRWPAYKATWSPQMWRQHAREEVLRQLADNLREPKYG